VRDEGERRMRGRRRAFTAATALALSLTALPARAALTDSEKGQVRSYLESGELGTVARLRALIARPDLSEREATDVLSAALRPRVFDDEAEAYLEALLFGPASHASRSTLMSSVVRALLSRADAVFVQQPGDPMRGDARAGDELMRIHRFVDHLLARARASEAKGVAGLQPDARRRIAESYAEHVERHRTWLGFAGRVQGETLLLRAQVALVLNRASEGVVDRNDTAEVLGLGAAAGGLFQRTGTLFDDGGLGPEVRRQEVVSMLENVPGSLRDIDLVVVSKVPRRAWAPGDRVMFLRTPLGPVAPRREDLWPSSVRVADPELAWFETAWVASSSAIRRRLAEDEGYASRVQQALANADGKGEFGTIAPWLLTRSLDRDARKLSEVVSLVDFAAASATLLLLDVKRTVDLASMRSLSGRPESFEQLLLGLDALAPGAGSTERKEIRLGKVTVDGIRPVTVEVVVEDGRVAGLAFDGHRYDAAFGSDGRVAEVRLDGETYEVGDLSAIEVPTTSGDRWQVGETEFVRLFGRPELGALGRRRFVLTSAAGTGMAAVYTQAPTADHEVRCRIGVNGKQQVGVIGRASTGASGFHGAGVLVGCDEVCRAQLVWWDGQGGEQPLGSSVVVASKQPTMGLRVALTIEGKQVRAKVADKELRGRLQSALPPGHVGWVVRSEARISVRDWTIEEASSTAKP
jgi:hypothetical protein